MAIFLFRPIKPLNSSSNKCSYVLLKPIKLMRPPNWKRAKIIFYHLSVPNIISFTFLNVSAKTILVVVFTILHLLPFWSSDKLFTAKSLLFHCLLQSPLLCIIRFGVFLTTFSKTFNFYHHSSPHLLRHFDSTIFIDFEVTILSFTDSFFAQILPRKKSESCIELYVWIRQIFLIRYPWLS